MNTLDTLKNILAESYIPAVKSEWRGIEFRAPIFVDINAPIPAPIYFLYALEIVLLVTGLISVMSFMHFFNASSIFHVNVKRLLNIFVVTFVLGTFSRFYLILVQAQITTDIHTFACLLASLLRSEHYAAALNVPTGLAIERSFATIFIDDYEKTSRLWVTLFTLLIGGGFAQVFTYTITFSALLGSGVFFAFISFHSALSNKRSINVNVFKSIHTRPSFFANFLSLLSLKTTIFVLGYRPFIYYAVYILSISISSYMTLKFLYRLNVRKYELLSWQNANNRGKKISTADYTLSRKFQVEENLKIIRMLSSGSLIMTIFVSIASLICFLATYIFGIESEMGQFLLACFDLVLAMANNFIPHLAMYILRLVREPLIYNLFPCYRRTPRKKFRTNAVNDTQTYFSQLQNSWN